MPDSGQPSDKQLIPRPRPQRQIRAGAYSLSAQGLPGEKPAPAIFPNWRTFGSFCHIKALAVWGHTLWAATGRGVVRWQFKDNLVQYTRYGSEHGLPGSRAAGLTLDLSGRLWVGHNGFGLSYFDSGQWYSIPFPGTADTVKITTLSSGIDNKVWLGTSQGIGYVEKEQIHFPLRLPPVFPGDAIQTLVADPKDGIWLGTVWGLYHYKPGAGLLKRYTVADGLPSNSVLALASSATGKIWVGTSRGICMIEEGQVSPHPFIDAPVLDISIDQAGGQVWICTPDEIAYWSRGKWNNLADPRSLFEAYITTEPAPTAVAAGQRGRGWVGFSTGLIHHMPLSRPRILAIPVGENQLPNSINALAVDGSDTLWVGTDQGLFYLDNGHWRLCKPQEELLAGSPPLVAVRTVVISPLRNEIWIGSWEQEGVRRLRNFGEIPLPLSPATSFVEGLTCSTSGDLWLITQQHLCQYTGDSWQEPIMLPEDFRTATIHSLLTTEGGIVWCGTSKGLYRYDGAWTGPLLSTGIFSMTIDRQEDLWVGTEAGLFRLKQGAIVKRLTHQDGLPANEVRVVVMAKNGTLWVGTNRGLAHVKQDQVNQIWDVQNSGLTDNRIRALAIGQNGQVWIGTANGISLFDC